MKEQYDALELSIVKQQIAKNCCFSLGRQFLLDLSPSFDYLWVSRELHRSKEALQLVIQYGDMPFPGLYDVSDSVADARRDAILRPFELQRIAQQAHTCKAIQSYMKSSECKTPYLDEICESFLDTMKLSKAIEQCIDANSEVMDHASPQLAGIRRSIRGCEGDISKAVQRFMSSHSSILMDTITTTRNDRICVLVKVSEKNSIRGFIHGESASGQTAYVEPESLLLLNNRLQSLRSQESEEIQRILYELSQLVKEVANEILANQDSFALLDMSFAKGIWAKNHNGCVAELIEDAHQMRFVKARHPLIDPKQVVANTYVIQEPYRSLLITGSNTGGKTVTLKTIGLFACMSQCGLPILAEEATMPFFHQIFVDIGDDQSIQESLSTFSSHIRKLADICRYVDASSLVLLDELGSGTDPKEGESLAIAILDELRSHQAMVIATTHYSGLKTYAKKTNDVLISSVAFDVENMRPTYRYMEGVSGQSNAFAIAARYDMLDRVLRKAQEIKDASRTVQDELMEKLEAELLENEDKRQQLDNTLADVKVLQEQLISQKNMFEAQKKTLLEKAKEEFVQEMEATKTQADAIIAELKSLSTDVKPHVITKLKRDLDDLDETEKSEVVKAEFKVGDYVVLRKLNYYGDILELNKDKVCVFANGMRMNTKLSEIDHAIRPVRSKKDKGYSKQVSKASFSMELNVIGMRVQEAIPVIDKYLDNAILAKVFSVRIIHGVGTGALRIGVHNYLKKNPHVDEFRMGGQGEGGLGASVVTLKQRVKKNG